MEQILARRIGGYAETGPVLALLPFATPGGGEAEALVAQGLLEDIAAELTRFPLLQVISWMSGLAVADLPDAEAGARLGASHVLRGGLRRRGERLRITATLVETAGARQILERRLRCAGRGHLRGAGRDRRPHRRDPGGPARGSGAGGRAAQTRREPRRLGGYAARACSCCATARWRPTRRRARHFERAIAIDPHYARAHVGLSLSHFNEWSCQHWDLFERQRRAGLRPRACRARAGRPRPDGPRGDRPGAALSPRVRSGRLVLRPRAGALPERRRGC